MILTECHAASNERWSEGPEGPEGGDGGGITYWAEKAKKRMTALSVARSNGERDGRGAAAAALRGTAA